MTVFMWAYRSADMKMFTDVIHKAQLLDGNRVYCVSLPKNVTERFSKSFDLKEKLFNFSAFDGRH